MTPQMNSLLSVYAVINFTFPPLPFLVLRHPRIQKMDGFWPFWSSFACLTLNTWMQARVGNLTRGFGQHRPNRRSYNCEGTTAYQKDTVLKFPLSTLKPHDSCTQGIREKPQPLGFKAEHSLSLCWPRLQLRDHSVGKTQDWAPPPPRLPSHTDTFQYRQWMQHEIALKIVQKGGRN